MQVSLLKLNAGISRAVTAADTFDRQNSSLREDISKLDSGERIQAVAAKLGMVTPAAGDVHYLDGRGADGARAAASIKPPEPVTRVAAPAATTHRAGRDDDRARDEHRRARDGHRRGGDQQRRAGDDERRPGDDHHRAGDDHHRPATTTTRTAPRPTPRHPRRDLAAVAGGASAPQGQG